LYIYFFNVLFYNLLLYLQQASEYAEENDEIAPTQAAGSSSTQNSKKKSKGRKKPAYAGGLVLEPKKGKRTLVFRSLGW